MRLFIDPENIDASDIGDHYYSVSLRALYRKDVIAGVEQWFCIGRGDAAEHIYHQIRRELAWDEAINNNDPTFGVF